MICRPLDIRGFQPSPLESPASQNPCDVINHLHGDHQRPDHQQEMQKSPPSCSQGSPDDPQANYMRQKANGAGEKLHFLCEKLKNNVIAIKL